MNRRINKAEGNSFLILTVGSEPKEDLPLPEGNLLTLDLREEEVDWDAVLMQIFESQKIMVW